jgi:hypothetical protein
MSCCVLRLLLHIVSRRLLAFLEFNFYIYVKCIILLFYYIVCVYLHTLSKELVFEASAFITVRVLGVFYREIILIMQEKERNTLSFTKLSIKHSYILLNCI